MAKAKKLTSEDKLTGKEISPEDRTATFREPAGPVAQEAPAPPPIDPLWEQPPPPEPPPPHPAPISEYSAGDSQQYGTEFPPRLFALGYEDQEAVSTILGQPPAELEPLGDDATAITRRKPAAEAEAEPKAKTKTKAEAEA